MGDGLARGKKSAVVLLGRSQEFYNLFVQTGEHRYLALCQLPRPKGRGLSLYYAASDA